MRFRLVPKSETLVDPELTLNGHYALYYITHIYFGAHHKNLNARYEQSKVRKVQVPEWLDALYLLGIRIGTRALTSLLIYTVESGV